MKIHAKCDHLDGVLISFMKSVNKGWLSGLPPSDRVRFHKERQVLLLLANQLAFIEENSNDNMDIRLLADTLEKFKAYFRKHHGNIDTNLRLLGSMYSKSVVDSIEFLLK